MSPTTTIQQEAAATLRRLEKKDPGLKQLLKQAHGYSVFPSVGKASLVVGGSYGKGAVFERGKFIGYATIAQTTVGVELGGDTYAEVIAFENKSALERFKRGKMAFAADASAVLIKAGAAAAKGFGNGTQTFVYGDGGMLLEAAIGGQKFKFKPAAEHGSGGDGQEQHNRQKDEEQPDDGEGADIVTEAASRIRKTASTVTNLVTEHPIAATLLGAGAAAGLAVLMVRVLRSLPASASHGEQNDDQGDAEEPDEQRGDDGEGRYQSRRPSHAGRFSSE